MSRRRMRHAAPALLAVLTLSLVGTSLAVGAGQGDSKAKPQREFDADLIGHNEVPPCIRRPRAI